MSLPQELFGLLRGVQVIAEAGFKIQKKAFEEAFQNYTVKSLVHNALNATENSNTIINQKSEDIIKSINEVGENLNIVAEGINQFISHSLSTAFKDARTIKPPDDDSESDQKLLKKVDQEIVLTPGDKDLLKKLDVEHMKKQKASPVAAAVNLHLTTKTDYTKPNQSKQEEPKDDNFDDSKTKKKKK